MVGYSGNVICIQQSAAGYHDDSGAITDIQRDAQVIILGSWSVTVVTDLVLGAVTTERDPTSQYLSLLSDNNNSVFLITFVWIVFFLFFYTNLGG